MTVDYSNGKIYKMISISGLIYIGSTTTSLAERKAKHKNHYNAWKRSNGVKYNMSVHALFEDSPDDVDIVLMENVDCNSKEELHTRERYWIENTNCVNIICPIRSKIENRMHNNELGRIYRETNKLYIQAYRTRKYACECGSIVSAANKAVHYRRNDRHRQYIKDIEYEKFIITATLDDAVQQIHYFA